MQHKSTSKIMHLKQRCSLPLLVSTNFKVLAPLDWVLGHMFAALALEPQDNLLRGLCLLVEDWFGLTTITRLLAIVTTLPLSSNTSLACLVLCNLVQGVLLALLALAVSLLCLVFLQMSQIRIHEYSNLL